MSECERNNIRFRIRFKKEYFGIIEINEKKR